MEHVVFFPASDGNPAFRRLPSVEEAVRLVEHLRNVEGVEQVSVHALTEVPLAFRAYYRVELPAPPARPAEPVAALPVEVPAAQPDSAQAHAADALRPEAAADLPPADVPDEEAAEQAPEQQVHHVRVEVPVQGGEPEPVHPLPPSLGFFA